MSIPVTPSSDAPGRPLRILQIVPTYYPAVRYGGPIRSVHALAVALVRRGHEVTVYTTSLDGDRDSDVPVGVPVDRDGVRVVYFRVPALRRLAWCPALAHALRRTIDGFDVVHVHSVFQWPTYAGARIAARHRVPYLIAPRGMLMRDAVRRKSRLVKSAWIRLIERRSMADAAGLHATADIEAHEVEAMGFAVRATFCVPNGVSWPASHGALSDGPYANLPRPYALFLSRINRKKGLDRLIRAWALVRDLTLVIAGNDDEDCLPELRELAAREGVLERLRFIGPVGDADKWAVYAAAELFVLPSYSENFGNVVAEAMAMACPVVVTPEVGLAPFVQEVGAGIVSPGEPGILARSINALHDDAPRRRRLGAAGHAAAVERLSWDGVAEQMATAYRSVIAAQPARH
jgi:glycosyltransferase involved in cell wall biosynthesis